MLISFEGIDGSGKTTISRLVASSLSNQLGKERVLWTNEPNSIMTRDLLRNVRSEEERLFLFLADRARHMTTVLPSLSAGNIVIIDRYIDSSYAYVSEDMDRFVTEHGLDLFQVILMSCGWRVPDVTFLIDIPVEVAVRRMLDRDGYIDVSMDRLTVARERYLRLADRFSDRMVIVDGTLPPDSIAYSITERLLSGMNT